MLKKTVFSLAAATYGPRGPTSVHAASSTSKTVKAVRQTFEEMRPPADGAAPLVACPIDVPLHEGDKGYDEFVAQMEREVLKLERRRAARASEAQDHPWKGQV